MTREHDQLKLSVAALNEILEEPANTGVRLSADELKDLRVKRAQAVVQAARAVLDELQGRKTVYRGGSDT